MKVKLIVISIILLLVMVFASGCIPIMEKLGLVSPTNEEQLTPEKGGPPDGLVKVLIGFKEKPGAAQQAMVKGVGGKIKYTYHIVDAIAASIPEKAIVALQNNPNVKYVEPDVEIFAVGQTLPWGVNRIDAEVVWTDDYMGQGVDVAIIDSGIDKDHLDLKDNIIGGENFVSIPSWKTPDPDKWDDDYGHGTHVAGIVAALNNAIGVVGVAPEADLYALKVLDKTGRGNYGDVIAAIEWCVKEGIQVTNNSYGSSGYPGDTVKAAFDNSAAAGVLHVAAAGNENGGSVIYPARFSSVIAVSATDSADKLASFSSVGNEVDLAAPGVYIYSTYKDGGYATYSGTSMASPHVAGVAALVIAAGIPDVRSQLQNTAEDIGLSITEQGDGLVDAAAAVDVSLDTGNIEGKVTDEAGGAAIGGATIVVEGTNLSDTTDEKGYYLLENVPVETYDVSASADGYYSETATVTIVKDKIVTQDFVLQAIPTYTVSGTVTDAENSVLVLEGVTVTIEETGQLSITGNDGAYAISDVEGGTYNITAVKEGYSSQNKIVFVEEDITVNFALEEITEELQKLRVYSIDMWYKPAGPNRFVSTKVKIVLSNDTAVSGATVYLKTTLPDGSQVSSSGDTADDGTITFETKSRQIGTYISTVTKVTKEGWTYDSSANVETSDSIEVP